MADRFIIENSSAQNNVTGSGTAYTVTWDTVLTDNNAHISDGVAHLNESPYAIVGTCINFGGLGALNTRIVVSVTTSDGDFVLYDENISLSLGSTYTISASRMLYLNQGNVDPFTYTIKVAVYGGLTNTVDVLAGSQFWSLFV